jgi:NAD(P)H-flavin reductase
MENHIVKIVSVESVTHDVKRFTIQKPEGFKFIPGQATEVSINTPALKMKSDLYTSLNDNKQLNLLLKFMIVTTELQKELEIKAR